jgi:thymidylate synthase (FAD)
LPDNKIYYTLEDGKGFVELVDSAGSDSGIVRTARVSYAGDLRSKNGLTEKDKNLLAFLLKHRHMTPFEHTMIKFHVKAPMFVARQWMRHRIGWSYNEISRRYTSEDIDFYIPSAHQWRSQSAKNKQSSAKREPQGYYSEYLREHVKESLELYNGMINDGISREQARMVLPQNMYTRFYATTNLRALMHFYELRSKNDAQWEIRKYAWAMSAIAGEVYPESWQAFTKFVILNF